MELGINEYTREKTCVYKGRTYYVRDNGAVYRRCKDDGLTRKNDEKWTFGKLDKHSNYMMIGSERVHRIVCTAYHGEAPSNQHVVDHINTIRMDNRPENLRWLTKLENALNNPITVKRIIYCCGSIEAFIENPSLLRESEEYRDISWMRSCSPAEAKIAQDNLLQWAKKPVPDVPRKFRRPVDDDIFNIFESEDDEIDIPSEFHKNVIQRNWSTPTQFPPCPEGSPEEPLMAYFSNLAEGCVTSRSKYGEWHLIKAEIVDDFILMFSQNKECIKPFAICRIWFDSGVYYHQSIRTFFNKLGAEKQFELSAGREWYGDDSIDDYIE